MFKNPVALSPSTFLIKNLSILLGVLSVLKILLVYPFLLLLPLPCLRLPHLLHLPLPHILYRSLLPHLLLSLRQPLVLFPSFQRTVNVSGKCQDASNVRLAAKQTALTLDLELIDATQNKLAGTGNGRGFFAILVNM